MKRESDGMKILDGIQAVIFDLDGTLVDSMWIWKQIDIDYLRMRGLEFPPDLLENIEGKSFSEMAVYFKERFCLTESLDEIKAEWNRMAYDLYANKVELKPGALRFLQILKENRLRTGIATSNSKELVFTVLDSLGIRSYFDEIHTACEVAKGKPAPDIYLLVAEALGVAPEHCLVFEDIHQGILAAKAAGMRVFAVKDAFSAPQEEEKRREADRMIENFVELLPETEVAQEAAQEWGVV